MTHPSRETGLRVGVVGAGRVGAVLAAALEAAGHHVVAAAGESDASRSRIADLLPGVRHAKPTDVARSCDLLLLTVPDDMLANVVEVLSDSGALRPGQYVVHTSGRHGLGVLAPAAQVGARVVAMHPAMTFTGTALDLDRLPGCVFGLTAEACGAGVRGGPRRRPRWPPDVGARGDAHALPLGSRPRRQPPGHPGQPGDGAARRRRRRRPGRYPPPAADRGPRQRARAGRLRTDRPDRARRPQHRPRPTSPRSRRTPRTRSRRTSRWPATPSTAWSPTVGCCRSGPPRSSGSSTTPSARPDRARAVRRP